MITLFQSDVGGDQGIIDDYLIDRCSKCRVHCRRGVWNVIFVGNHFLQFCHGLTVVF
jgi:hypothetical protein